MSLVITCYKQLVSSYICFCWQRIMIPTDSHLTADVNEVEKIMRNTAVTKDNKETMLHYLHVTRKAQREIILKGRNKKNNNVCRLHFE